MLRPVPNSRRAFAAQASKLSGTGPRDDEIRLLRRAALEYSSALEHKAARLPCNVPDDPLEADERGGAVAAVHHQVVDSGRRHKDRHPRDRGRKACRTLDGWTSRGVIIQC